MLDPLKDIESKLHLQLPVLLRLELDRAKMLDRKLQMNIVAGKIVESFKTDSFVIWSEGSAGVAGTKTKKALIISRRTLSYPQLENTMLNAVELRSVKGIQRAFIVENERLVNASDGSTQAEVERFPGNRQH